MKEMRTLKLSSQDEPYEIVDTYAREQISALINLQLSPVMSAIYPIGSVYITTSSTSPSELFGFGTWEQIKDMFLLASGDNYSAGSIGGESEHILTINEMPSHTHTYKRHAFNNTDSDPETGESVYGASNKTIDAHIGETSSSGVGLSHNNMPPYLAVYIWKRTA